MNIELHGFPIKKAKEIQSDIWDRLIGYLSREESSNCLVTIIPSFPQDKNARRAPFIRVFHNSLLEPESSVICQRLKPIKMPGAGMKVLVEFVNCTSVEL